MERTKSRFLRTLLWILVANALTTIGWVMYIQHSYYLPEYGQYFWWAWKEAFYQDPENILFIVAGIIAFVILQIGEKKNANSTRDS